ncbi:MAG TPA: O-antigen ligase family protein [Candidatus Acidoferrum sp.]|nr:O-antigen ligase family protein [Candidatus Acidoferrum sp.]
MNFLGFLITLVCGLLLFRLPRRWALVPLLVGTTYLTQGQAVQIGPASFSVIRLLVLAGFIRVKSQGEHVAGGMRTLDRAMIGWAVCAVVTSLFHKEPGSQIISMLGIAFDFLGLYFLMRVFIQSLEDLRQISKALLIMMVPLALEMAHEKITGRNIFSVFGYVTEMATVRGGKIRAQGPFAHSILAGTVAAVCMPLAIFVWRESRLVALIGLAATGIMVLTSASSGPILTAAAIIGALGMWKFRSKLRLLLWGVVVMLVALNFIMNDPVYFLLARIDLTGKSTGWHRAELIDAAVKHLDEWWLAGTDYTRHWMPTGVYWTQNHTDITNHYLKMGVWGGLPLMMIFIYIMATGFANVGKTLDLREDAPPDERFYIWVLGGILFGHAVSFVSISYFDQTIVYFCLSLAAIGSVYSVTAAAAARAVEAAPAADPALTEEPCPSHV